ncbi:hypothetical protein [Cellulomonas sp. KRMCY2]|uniref:hypothetical protein n=1 Tax=Cellulomonas sp. KRMCY2 TaxID=1304865 RepID=UPI00045EA62B|nr:hypothetical protein [Cellulomonas sp. KRMCY2]
MSDDVADGLRELAADAGTAHAAGGGFPTAAMARRARRNRRVRGTATAVAATLTTTGVVLAGVAVAGLRHDDSLVADPWVADQWDVDYSACGLSLDELGWRSQAQGPAVLAATSSGDGTDWGARSDAAGNLTVTTVLVSSATDARLTLVAPRPDFVIQSAGGGVVVGVLGAPAGQEPAEGLVPPATTPHVTAAPMYSCAAADGRTALEAGDYVLAGSQQAVFEDPDGTERTYLAQSQQRLDVPSATPSEGPSVAAPPIAAPTVEVTAGPGPTLADLPVEVPLVVERLLRIEAVDDATWQVTVEFDDRDGYARARAALVDAGFAVDGEETSADRPFWSFGTFSSPRYTVTLDVSNETGGGFLGDYLITTR